MTRSDPLTDQQAAQAVVRHHSELAATMDDHGRIDVRDLPDADQHAQVLAALDTLPSGVGLVLVTLHAPLPLLAEIDSRYSGQVAGEWLHSGPDVWQIRLHRKSLPVIV